MSTQLFDNPTTTRPRLSGSDTQRLYVFDNGWAASVMRFDGSNESGLWELAVLKGIDGGLSYDSGITDDMIGNLTPDAVDEVLTRIAGLPKR